VIGPALRVTQVTSHRVLRTAERLARGARRAAFDLAPPESPTPRLQVWSRDKVRLFRYLTPEGVTPRDAPPLLLVMSLVTTSLVFDLQENNSLVRRFLDEGYDVYLLDWGVPDAVDSANSLQTYCDEYLPRAVQATLRES
jgi:polyhydroxyalkanoate synthase subunit PhaC